MLAVVTRLSGLHFGQLMEVYAEGNRENGAHFWPQESQARQLALAEEGFYQYLREVFFETPGAKYCIWQEQGRYVSALRLEPYRDGLLLEALETSPQDRRKGWASRLLQEVLAQEQGKIYSHVGKKNAASLRTHEKCGFVRISDRAVYADGSVDARCHTLLWEKSAQNPCKDPQGPIG